MQNFIVIKNGKKIEVPYEDGAYDKLKEKGYEIYYKMEHPEKGVGLIQDSNWNKATSKGWMLSNVKEKLDKSRAQAEAKRKPMSKLAAGTLGATQGLSYGTADEIAAAIQTPFSDKSYKELLKEQQDMLKRAQKDQPGTYLTTDIASSFLAPGGFIRGGAKTAGKFLGKQAVKEGTEKAAKKGFKESLKRGGKEVAKVGAATGAEGFARGEGSVKDRLDQAKDAAAFGAGTTGVLKTAGATAKGLGKAFKEATTQKELAQFGNKLTSEFMKAPNKKKVAENLIRKEKLITTDPIENYENVQKLRLATGQALDELKPIMKKAPEIVYDGDKYAESMLEVLDRYKLRNDGPQQTFLLNTIEDLMEAGSDPDTIEMIKRKIGKVSDSNSEVADAASDAYAAFSRTFDKGLKELGTQISDPDLLKKYRETATKYHILSKLEHAASKMGSSGISKHFAPAATSGIFGAAGGVTGGQEGAIAGIFGGYLLKKYGVVGASRIMNKIEQAGPKKVKAFNDAIAKGNKTKAASILAKQGIKDVLGEGDYARVVALLGTNEE